MKAPLLLFVLLGLVAGCQQFLPQQDAAVRKGMIKVSVFYPNEEGSTFDMEYYSTKHFALVSSLLGTSLKSYAIDKGVAGGNPDTPAPYLAIGHLYFDSLDDFQNSFGPNAEVITDDLPNYTNTQPIVLISEVVQ
jgi:uncharacterized protein (TIGR02118 family)